MMKRILNIREIVFATLLVALSITSCDDAKYSAIETLIYIQETGTKTFYSEKVAVREVNVAVPVTAKAGKMVTKDTQVKIKIDAAATEEFNKKNGTNYATLPEGSYILEDETVVIKAGEVSANTVNVMIKPLSEDLAASGKTFVLPISIIPTSGEETLKGSDAIFYIIDPLIITSVPVINNRNNLKMVMRQDYDLNTWSIEFRLSIDTLGKGIGKYNNQAMFRASAPAGKDGEIYTRFGDAPIDGRKLQIKNQGSQFDSNLLFDNRTWYHIAYVNDGKKLTLYVNGVKNGEMATPGKVTSLGKESFAFGNTDYLVANVKLSEMRFWTRAITETQIINNMFSIDPAMDGLEAYWKMNEGSGNEFKDYTGHGNKCTSVGTTRWVHSVKAENKPDADVESK